MSYEIRHIPSRIACLSPLLVRAHYEEVSSAARPLAVDWLKYQSLESAGLLVGLGAFADDELVGYSATIVDRHIHYDLVTAYNAALFVHPDHRATPLGLKLMRATKDAARERGANLMLWHAKPDSQLNTLLTRKRLKVQDIVYQESL